MNKTININLGGFFFHIDETAYQKLKQYLDAIRRSLNDDSQGQEEILNDIELRISELLSERIKNDRQVINEADIDAITKIMGSPEDYLVDEELFEEEGTSETSKTAPKTTSKKLFRDKDDKFLGGVCAGLGHFINIDALWIRILWLVLISFFGTGILLYIILWILVPTANTTAEKLQMKGEPVNISNIEKKIREELNDVSTRVKDGASQFSEKLNNPEFKKNIENNTRAGIHEVVDTLLKLVGTILKIFGKFIGAFIILITSIIFIALIVLAFSFGSFEIIGFDDTHIQDLPFFFNSVFPAWLLVLITFISIAIPTIALFMVGLKIISNNVKSFGTTTKLTLLGLWILSIIGIIFAGINFASQKAHDGIYNKTENIAVSAIDTLQIKMIADDNLSNKKELGKSFHFESVYDKDIKKLYSTNINLDIKSTDNETPFVKIRKKSEGNTRLSANKNAEAIEYQFELKENNKLALNGYFLSDIKNKFNDLAIDITIYLPVNYVIYLDESTKTFLNDVDNVQDIYDRDMSRNYYKMTSKGLSCLDCDSAIFSEGFNKENGSFNMKIDEDGLKINVNEGKTNDAEIKIDKSGVSIK